MKDKETMRMKVDHIPTHQETVDKCLEAFKKVVGDIDYAKDAYEMGCSVACKSFLTEAEQTIEEIRVLIGGSNG